MGTIKIGMIGCGSRPIRLLRSVPGLGDALQIAAVCDPHAPSRDALCKEHAPEAVVCDSYEELLAIPNLDWIWISSWNCHHRAHAVAALNAGKHVFCEKPLALTVEDCLAIGEAVKRNQKRFCLGLVLRYSPHFQAIKQLLDAGEIGAPISFEFNETLHFDHGGYIHGDWRRLTRLAGPHILEKCCHDLDIVQWLLGHLPLRVASFGGCSFFTPQNADHMQRIGRNDAGREAYNTWDRVEENSPFTSEKDIVDNQVAILSFPNGVHASFHTNCNTAIPERRLYICGTEGTLRADVCKNSIEISRTGYPVQMRQIDADSYGQHGGGDQVLGVSIADTMRCDTPPLAGIDEGITSTVTALAIEQARTENRIIDLQEQWAALGITP